MTTKPGAMAPETLAEAVRRYLAAQSKSESTVSTAGSALNRLIAILGGDLPLAELSADDAVTFHESLQNDGLKYKTVATYQTMVLGFLKYLVLRRWASFTMDDLERAREVIASMNGRPPQPLPKLPDEEAVQAILKLATEQVSLPGTERQELTALRNLAMLHVLRSTGVRVQEMLDMKIGDVDMETDGGSAQVTGKGSKQRVVFFDEDAAQWLSQWLYEHPDGGEDSPVFVRLDRKAKDMSSPLTSESVRWVLRGLCKQAGVKNITPHQFRHRFGTAVYLAAGLGPTADLMGHADPGVTRVYAKLAKKHMQAVHAKAKL